MTDEQFEKLVSTMSQRQADHDLLVEINTIVRLNHENYQKEKVDVAEKIGAIKKTSEAAHKRLDYIFTGVMVSIGGLVMTALAFFLSHK